MLMLNHLNGFDATTDTAALPSLSYRTTTNSSAASSSPSFLTVDIGTAGATRFVIVAVTAGSTGGSNSISTCTVGGTGLTQAVSAVDTGNQHAAAIFIGNIASGITATINPTLSGGSSARWSIGVWAAYDLSSATATATATQTTSAATQTLSVNVQDSGIIIGVGYCFQVGNFTWTGLTEQYDAAVNSTQHSGGDYTATTAQTPLSITLANASGNSGPGCTAAFR